MSSGVVPRFLVVPVLAATRELEPLRALLCCRLTVFRLSPCCSGCNWHRAQWGAKNRNWCVKSLVYRKVFGARPGMSLMEQVELRYCGKG